MTSSSALTFRVPNRDNFAEAQSAESKAATRVTVKLTIAEAPAPTVAVSTPRSNKRVGVHLDAKA